MNLVFHPHGWSDTQQIVELIDYAARKSGKRVSSSFAEALRRLEKEFATGSIAARRLGQAQLNCGLLDVNGEGTWTS